MISIEGYTLDPRKIICITPIEIKELHERIRHDEIIVFHFTVFFEIENKVVIEKNFKVSDLIHATRNDLIKREEIFLYRIKIIDVKQYIDFQADWQHFVNEWKSSNA